MGNRLRARELERLCTILGPKERDKLLQCLLIAAAQGGEAMIKVLKQLLVCHATEEILKEHASDST